MEQSSMETGSCRSPCFLSVDSVRRNVKNLSFSNGKYFLRQPKTKCEPHALMHGDEVKMGETVLSFHIHSGTDTCDGCEPGQVMAHLSKYRREEKAGEEAKFYSRPERMISQLQVFSETLYSLQAQLSPKKIKKP